MNRTVKRANGWKDATILLASLLLMIPGQIHAYASGGGDGGVVCGVSRVQDELYTSTSGSGTSLSTSGPSLQALFSQNAFLEFRGTTQALSNLDSQLLALGSADAKIRVSSMAMGAAGASLDFKAPIQAFSGITTWLDVAAISGGGGYGGVICCTTGTSPSTFLGAWTGNKIAVDFKPIADSSLLWNTPVVVTLIPAADPTKAVKLTIQVSSDCVNTVNIKLSPVSSS